MPRRVSSAPSARARCSYRRLAMAELYSLDSPSCESPSCARRHTVRSNWREMAGARVEEAEVVIAGAGPAGLATAAALARYGIGSTLVERRPRLSALPRATAVSTRSMELLRALGLEDEVRAHEVDAGWDGLAADTLAS